MRGSLMLPAQLIQCRKTISGTDQWGIEIHERNGACEAVNAILGRILHVIGGHVDSK